MSESNKPICPLLSIGSLNPNKCVKEQCAFYIYVYTTERHSASGCAIALLPQMIDGQLRV